MIELENVSKNIDKKNIINNISFSVNQGEIVGLLGPNGSGKSTTMKIIAGYFPPTNGKINVCGYDVKRFPEEIKPYISYLPEGNPLYSNMYTYEYLNFIGNIYEMNKKDIKRIIMNIMKKCHLEEIWNKKIKNLSKGYKQRVGIAQCLIHNPSVLILDEPTTGLDPNHIVEIRNIIKEISKSKAVILSTHIMQEVESICDRVIIINKGEIVINNKIENLKKESFQNLILELKEKVNLKIFDEIKNIKNIYQKDGKYIIEVKEYKDIREEIFNHIKRNNLTLLAMSQQKISIEDVFSRIIQKSF